MGLLPSVICWVCFTLFFFFRLSLLYHLMFRIYVGLFFPGELALLQFFFFLLESRINNFLFFYLRVFLIFFKGKQIKNF